MSCCGKMRTQLGATFTPAHGQHVSPRPSPGRFGRFPMGSISFEYIGATAITAVGATTGRQYRFSTPGVLVAVDARDRWSLAKVPKLREVGKL
jgi:hypothetical protein